MWRLLYPLRYFGLINAQKRWIDLSAILVGALIAAPYWVLKASPFFGAGGFLDKILGLTSALTGFYVAALVAAATFAHPDLDRVIVVGPIYEIRRIEGGGKEKEPLTRREFACVIFGYLAFASLLISVASAVAVTISQPLKQALVSGALASVVTLDRISALRSAAVFLFTVPLAHIAVVTGLGLYYLMERLHTREPRVLATKDGQRAA